MPSDGIFPSAFAFKSGFKRRYDVFVEEPADLIASEIALGGQRHRRVMHFDVSDTPLDGAVGTAEGDAGKALSVNRHRIISSPVVVPG